jgi:hypothetical protein
MPVREGISRRGASQEGKHQASMLGANELWREIRGESMRYLVTGGREENLASVADSVEFVLGSIMELE